MTTQILGHNLIGFRSGMHKSCSSYLNAAVAFRSGDTAQQEVPPAVDRSLSRRQILMLPPENLTVICLAGELWLTRDGDIEDYFLGPGQKFTVRRGDKAAVQALQTSQVRLLAI